MTTPQAFNLNYGSDSIQEPDFGDYIDLVVFDYFSDHERDRDGVKLLSDVDSLLKADLTEDQLESLIVDKWSSCGGPRPDKTWRDVLEAVRKSLMEYQEA